MNKSDGITIRVSDYTHTREVRRFLWTREVEIYGGSAAYAFDGTNQVLASSSNPLSTVDALLHRTIEIGRQGQGAIRVILDLSPRGEEYVPEIKERITEYAAELGTTVTFERKQD